MRCYKLSILYPHARKKTNGLKRQKNMKKKKGWGKHQFYAIKIYKKNTRYAPKYIFKIPLLTLKEKVGGEDF